MPTLRNRPWTALLVVDVQVGVVAGTHNAATVVANIKHAVEEAHSARVPVIRVRPPRQG